MRNFRELEVWKEGIKLVVKTYKIANTLPTEEKYGLISQIKRCAVSIPSNISEGCSRRTSADFARFLDNSLGSSFELETQMILAFELEFIEKEILDKFVEELNVLQRRINALREAILKTKD